MNQSQVKPIKIISVEGKPCENGQGVDYTVTYRKNNIFTTLPVHLENGLLTSANFFEDYDILTILGFKLCEGAQKQINSYYRYMSLQEYQDYLAGKEIKSPVFYGVYTTFKSDNLKGIFLMDAPDCYSFLFGSVATDILVEFEPVQENLKFGKALSTCNDPFTKEPRVIYVNQYTLPSYSNKILKEIRHMTPDINFFQPRTWIEPESEVNDGT